MPAGYTTDKKIPQFPLNFTQGIFGGIVSASGGGITNFLRADGRWVPPPGTVVSANPTAVVGLSAVNGTAPTFMTSDSAPALSQAIVPTWTGAHTFNAGITSTTLTLTTGQYQAWTPTFTSGGGTLGTTTLNTARYQQMGKQIHFYIDVQITSVGTSPTGQLVFTLPVTPRNAVMTGECCGWENVNSTTIAGYIFGQGPNGRIAATSGINILLNGNRLVFGGMYEAA